MGDDYLEEIKALDLKGKPVAVFGCGDSQGYGDNFCDAIEEMHSTFKAAGAKMLGAVDASGYTYSESKSEQDGKFLGLPLDQDNEDDQTEGRVSDWISQLKSKGMPLRACMAGIFLFSLTGIARHCNVVKRTVGSRLVSACCWFRLALRRLVKQRRRAIMRSWVGTS